MERGENFGKPLVIACQAAEAAHLGGASLDHLAARQKDDIASERCIVYHSLDVCRGEYGGDQ